MQIDTSALAILDLKCERLRRMAADRRYDAWLGELPQLLRWVLSVPVLRAYSRQILDMHEGDEKHLSSQLDRDIPQLIGLAADFRNSFSETAAEQGKWHTLQSWETFDYAVERVTAASPPSVEDQRSCAKKMADVVRSHTKHLADQAKRASDDADNVRRAATQARQSAEQRLAEETDDARRVVLAGEVDSAATAESVSATHATEAELSLQDIYARIADVEALAERVQCRIALWDYDARTSPRTALISLLQYARFQQDLADDVAHWTDILPPDARSYLALWRIRDEDDAQEYSKLSASLEHFVEELHVRGATTLSNRILIDRFKERCTWYDKPRLREVAQNQALGGKREDRLTLELARYLHDAGVFVIVRLNVGNLQPDVVGLQNLAVEAKAYVDSDGARTDILHGFYQLHAYMTSLETEAMRVREGFLVVFRLGGRIYETPPTVETGRFLIHSLTIDIGASEDSGRNQAPIGRPITEDEILNAIAKARATSAAPRERATRKGATKKGATKKGATKKGATKKGATKNGATKNGATKKGATKKGATKKGR